MWLWLESELWHIEKCSKYIYVQQILPFDFDSVDSKKNPTPFSNVEELSK